jgi:hypothetical protein
MAEIAVRLITKKVAADLFKGAVNYVSDKREAEKRNRALVRYASRVGNVEERNALVLFNIFSLEGNEAIENFKKDITSEEERDYISEINRRNNFNYSIMSRLVKTPERARMLENMEAKKFVLGTLKKIQDEPEYREKVFTHFHNLDEEIKNTK